jgi:hypothetical protein
MAKTTRKPGRPAKTAAPPGIEAAREARTAATAETDVNLLAHQLANDLQGLTEPEPEPAPPAYPEPDPEDASAQAHLLSTHMIQQERKQAEAEKDRRIDARASHKQQDKGRIPVESRVLEGSSRWRQGRRPDPFAIEDPVSGKSLVKRDEQGRPYDTHWVRVKDAPSDTGENSLRVRDRKWFGYEVVMTEAGEALKSECMIAMQAPVQAAAERIVYYASQGAFDNAKTVEHLEQRADAINSDYSRRHHGASQGVVGIQQMPEHRQFRGGLHEVD